MDSCLVNSTVTLLSFCPCKIKTCLHCTFRQTSSMFRQTSSKIWKLVNSIIDRALEGENSLVSLGKSFHRLQKWMILSPHHWGCWNDQTFLYPSQQSWWLRTKTSIKCLYLKSYCKNDENRLGHLNFDLPLGGEHCWGKTSWYAHMTPSIPRSSPIKRSWIFPNIILSFHSNLWQTISAVVFCEHCSFILSWLLHFIDAGWVLHIPFSNLHIPFYSGHRQNFNSFMQKCSNATHDECNKPTQVKKRRTTTGSGCECTLTVRDCLTLLLLSDHRWSEVRCTFPNPLASCFLITQGCGSTEPTSSFKSWSRRGPCSIGKGHEQDPTGLQKSFTSSTNNLWYLFWHHYQSNGTKTKASPKMKQERGVSFNF